MTAPDAHAAGTDGNTRGFIVLAVAVVVGVLLLMNLGAGGTSNENSSNTTTPPPTTAPIGGTTTIATTTTMTVGSGRTPSEVKVLVLNGGGPAGAAGATASQIGQSGYTMGEPANSPVQVDSTTIFYASDYQPDATSIALLLGKSPDVIKAISEAGFNGAEGDANVVVVLGPDAPPVEQSTTSTTSASGTTTTQSN